MVVSQYYNIRSVHYIPNIAMASVEVMESGEGGFLSQLERARREMRDRFRAVHELLQEREAALLAEFQELEDRFRGVGIADEMKQLSLSKEQLQNTLKGNTNQEVLQETIAPLERKMKELEMSLEKAKQMKTVDFDFLWEDSFTEKLKSLGRIQIKSEERCKENREVPIYKQKGVPISVFGKHNTKVKDPGNFSYPNTILFEEEKGYLYICDTGYNRVQVFDQSYQFLSMFSEKMNKPSGIAILQNAIYVTQYRGHCLNTYSQDYKIMQSVGEKGSREMEFDNPCGIAVSIGWNRIYICEYENNRIQCLNLDLSFHSFIPDIFGAKDVKLLTHELVVLCESNPCLRIYNSSHLLSRQMISKGEVNQVKMPLNFYVDANLNILLTDVGGHCVLIFSHTGELIHKFGKEGGEKGDLIKPRGITMDSEGRIIVNSENPHHCIQIF